MGQKYASLNDSGIVVGFYDSIDSPPPASAKVIPITDENWMAALTKSGQYEAGADNQSIVYVEPAAPTLAETVASLSTDIDNRVAGVYSTFTRFQQEYLNREAAATAFKAAGYTGDPGTYVTSYATAAGVTNQVAADTILAQATALNTALAGLAAQRMRKYAIAAAADVATAQSTHDDIVTKVNAIAAQLS